MAQEPLSSSNIHCFQTLAHAYLMLMEPKESIFSADILVYEIRNKVAVIFLFWILKKENRI